MEAGRGHIQLIAPEPSPRLTYAAHLMLGTLLGLDVSVLAPAEAPHPEWPRLHVGPTPPPNGEAWLWSHPMLFERHLPQQPLGEPLPGHLPQLFPAPQGSPSLLPHDPLAAAFYLAAQVEHYLNPPLDPHGRPDDSLLAPFRWGLEHEPLLHRYAQPLAEALTRHWPGLKPALPAYDYRFTVDVDHPWRYRHQPAWLTLAALVRDGLWGNFERLRVLLGRQTDPYDTFDLLEKLLPASKTVYFILLNGTARQDNRLRSTQPAMARLLQRLAQTGCTLGIHPSYLSSRQPELLHEQHYALGQLLGQPVVHARQHYLRQVLPHTRRQYLHLGIQHDWTSTAPKRPGFQYGVAVPFRWFDVLANTETALWIHPTTLMDRSHQHYLGQSPEQALEHAQRLLTACRNWGGHFVPLWHNVTFSGRGEWAGWQGFTEGVVAMAKQNHNAGTSV